MLELFRFVFGGGRSRGFQMMKKSKVGRRGPHGPVTSPLNKAVIADRDICLRFQKVLFYLKGGRIKKIVDQNDGCIRHKIERFIHGKAKGLGDLPGDLVALQLTLERIQEHEPILSARLNFLSASKHANP